MTKCPRYTERNFGLYAHILHSMKTDVAYRDKKIIFHHHFFNFNSRKIAIFSEFSNLYAMSAFIECKISAALTPKYLSVRVL